MHGASKIARNTTIVITLYIEMGRTKIDLTLKYIPASGIYRIPLPIATAVPRQFIRNDRGIRNADV
ncbi:hypothetical protein SAMN02745857_03107 [Andreprevotia lacus DSM 23236]|uniref:Uncharacterized protein n=1 Tax=Andreprevotia lacus DSM 23236 TaxID=1121001 RepID=A0A1W1XX20_9NEIS|nr:hypothetical protein SAMN02745857_03107 [Andreprevotia lacus DSM 23236]